MDYEKFMIYKQYFAKSLGYEYEVWIYDKKGEKKRTEIL